MLRSHYSLNNSNQPSPLSPFQYLLEYNEDNLLSPFDGQRINLIKEHNRRGRHTCLAEHLPYGSLRFTDPFVEQLWTLSNKH